MKEGLLIATAVFVVALVLALLFVYISVRLQPLGAVVDQPSAKPSGRRTIRMTAALSALSLSPS